jgi:hypothetical protein
MNLANLRTGLKNACANATGITAYAYWPDTCDAVLPAAVPVPGNINYWETFDDQSSLTFEIHVLAAWASDGFTVGQTALDAYIDETGVKSVKAALEADKTLGGKCQDLIVHRARDYHFSHRMAPNGPPIWGAILDVEIWVE